MGVDAYVFEAAVHDNSIGIPVTPAKLVGAPGTTDALPRRVDVASPSPRLFKAVV